MLKQIMPIYLMCMNIIKTLQCAKSIVGDPLPPHSRINVTVFFFLLRKPMDFSVALTNIGSNFNV